MKKDKYLFRGIIENEEKREFFGNWWYGDLIHYANGDICIRQQETGSDLKVDEKTVCQFTGFQDKFYSGKNIFDGDIFKNKSKNIYGVVCMSNGQWIVNFEDYSVPLYQYLMNDVKRETCGNIHENPELITF